MSDVAINQVIAQMRTMASAASAGAESTGAEQVTGANFSSLMQDSIEEVNAAMMESKALATSFESGDPQTSITEVMIASNRAGLEFQAMTEVRNKLLSAYQEIMSMQV